MEPKHFLPFYLILVSAAFLGISVLVFISRGNPFFVRHKLRIGALLLALSGSSTGCIPMTCYVPAPPNNFHIDQMSTTTNEIVINPSVNDTLSGSITSRAGNQFSFAVTDTGDTGIFQKDDVLPLDGAFDQETERFRITIQKDLVPGAYYLAFYDCPKDSLRVGDYYRHFRMKITN